MAKLTIKGIEFLRPGPQVREYPDGHISGLYYVLRPSGNASWVLRYRHRGMPRKLTIGPAARAHASKALVAKADGRDPAQEKQAARAAGRTPRDDDLVEKIAAIFIERHARPNTRPRSAAETERLLHKEIVPVWKGRRLSDIGKSDIHQLLDGFMDRDAPALANKVFGVFRKLCSWAVGRGLLAISPCNEIKAPKVGRARDRVLSDAASLAGAAQRRNFRDALERNQFRYADVDYSSRAGQK